MECAKRLIKSVVALGSLGIIGFGCSAQKAPLATDKARQL